MNERLPGMPESALSLDVGAKSGPPEIASCKVGGKIGTVRELAQDSEVHVTIANADGEVICSGYGIVNVAFKRHRATSRAPSYMERVHAIALE